MSRDDRWKQRLREWDPAPRTPEPGPAQWARIREASLTALGDRPPNYGTRLLLAGVGAAALVAATIVFQGPSRTSDGPRAKTSAPAANAPTLPLAAGEPAVRLPPGTEVGEARSGESSAVAAQPRSRAARAEPRIRRLVLQTAKGTRILWEQRSDFEMPPIEAAR